MVVTPSGVQTWVRVMVMIHAREAKFCIPFTLLEAGDFDVDKRIGRSNRKKLGEV